MRRTELGALKDADENLQRPVVAGQRLGEYSQRELAPQADTGRIATSDPATRNSGFGC